MEKALAEFVSISCVIEMQIEDITKEAIIERVRRSAHIDDAVIEADKPDQKHHAAAFTREAPREGNSAVAPAKGRSREEFKTLSAKEAIKLMHADASLNWGLFGIEETGLR